MIPALLGQGVNIIVQRRAAAMRQNLHGTQLLKTLFHEAEGKAKILGQGSAAGTAQNLDMPANKRVNQALVQAGLFQGARLVRFKRRAAQEHIDHAGRVGHRLFGHEEYSWPVCAPIRARRKVLTGANLACTEGTVKAVKAV